MASVKGESNINHLSLNNNETDIKIIVSGLSKVGKRSFLSKWINNEYTDDYKPSSFSQIGFKKVTIDDKKYNIGLWAISNNDDISIRTMGKNSNGLILICDNTNEETLKEIAIQYATELRDSKPLLKTESLDFVKDSDNCGILLISDWHYGMKIDNSLNTYNCEIAKQRV